MNSTRYAAVAQRAKEMQPTGEDMKNKLTPAEVAARMRVLLDALEAHLLSGSYLAAVDAAKALQGCSYGLYNHTRSLAYPVTEDNRGNR